MVERLVNILHETTKIQSDLPAVAAPSERTMARVLLKGPQCSQRLGGPCYGSAELNALSDLYVPLGPERSDSLTHVSQSGSTRIIKVQGGALKPGFNLDSNFSFLLSECKQLGFEFWKSSSCSRA